jgi:hypothetical protein
MITHFRAAARGPRRSHPPVDTPGVDLDDLPLYLERYPG